MLFHSLEARLFGCTVDEQNIGHGRVTLFRCATSADHYNDAVTLYYVHHHQSKIESGKTSLSWQRVRIKFRYPK